MTPTEFNRRVGILFTINVVGRGRSGRRSTLHTFTYGPYYGGWYAQHVGTNKQIQAGWVQPKPNPDYPEGPINAVENRDFPMRLAPGVTLPAAAVSAVLHALWVAKKPTVDIDDLKRVASQLGPQLRALVDIPFPERLAAERALYPDIVRRCTRV